MLLQLSCSFHPHDRADNCNQFYPSPGRCRFTKEEQDAKADIDSGKPFHRSCQLKDVVVRYELGRIHVQRRHHRPLRPVHSCSGWRTERLWMSERMRMPGIVMKIMWWSVTRMVALPKSRTVQIDILAISKGLLVTHRDALNGLSYGHNNLCSTCVGVYRCPSHETVVGRRRGCRHDRQQVMLVPDDSKYAFAW